MNRKAFTLIELLVVVAVLALLASIVFSNLGGAREGARVSNALSFQSQTHSLLGSDLVGWWNFNDPDDRYKDISGYDNHGSCTSCPTATDGVPGTGGTAMEFDGSSNHVLVKDAGKKVQNRDIVTISFWMKSTKLEQAWRNPLSFGSGKMRFETSGDATGFHVFNGPFSTLSFYSGIAVNKWHHVSLILDGDNAYLYIDANKKDSKSITGVINADDDMYLGLRYMNSGHWKGEIDDVRIYSRALTAQEVQTLYAQTKDRYLAGD